MKRISIPIGGQRFQLNLVKANHKVFEGDACMGVTLKDKNKFYFAKGYAQSQFDASFVHEVFHASFAVAGIDVLLIENLKEGVNANDFEETIIRRLELAWHPLLTHFKFQFPKVTE